MSGYDAWKLATPPEYAEERAEDAQETGPRQCVECGAELAPGDEGPTCGPCDSYGRHVDAQIDELREGDL